MAIEGQKGVFCAIGCALANTTTHPDDCSIASSDGIMPVVPDHHAQYFPQPNEKALSHYCRSKTRTVTECTDTIFNAYD